MEHKLKTLIEIENEAIESRLIECGYDTGLTAKTLGIARKTVYNRLYSIGLTAEDLEAGRKGSSFDLHKLYKY